VAPPDQGRVQAELDARPEVPIVERYEGPVSVNELEQAVREKQHG